MPVMAMREPTWVMVHVDQYNAIKSSPSQNCNAKRAYTSTTTMTAEATTHPRQSMM